jgi:hypothetical protein
MKTFKTIRPYVPPTPKPFTAVDDGRTIVVGQNYKRVPAAAHVVQEGLKWWKASLAVNGMSETPLDPNVTVVEEANRLIFKLDGFMHFVLDRTSDNLKCYKDLQMTHPMGGTLLDLIARWKREAHGTGPHIGTTESQIISDYKK